MADSKYSYNSMFASGFLSGSSGASVRSSEIGSRIDRGMSGFLPKDSLAGLKASMTNLHRELAESRTVDRGNIFEVNGRVADAYKNAFNSAMEASEKMKEKWDAEIEKKKPDIMKRNNPDDIKRLREASNPSKQDQSLLKKYDEAEKKFNNEKAKIDKKYGEPMSALGHQLQTMASNRGFIANTTQNMFDKMEKGEQPAFTGSFDSLIKENGAIARIENTASSGVESGMVNEVYRAKIGLQDLHVKSGQMFANPADPAKASKMGQLAEIGILSDQELDGNENVFKTNESAFRDQGEQIVGKLLGVDSVVKSQLGIDDKGGYVSAMNSAQGMSGSKYVVVKSQKELDEAQNRLSGIIGKCEKSGIEPKLNASEQNFKSPDLFLNLADPSLQKEAMKLGTVDFISGQFDRHSKNYFIGKNEDGTYKMTGIDNDGAFSSKKLNYATRASEALPIVTPELKDKILALDPDEVTNALKGVVDRGENGDEALRRVGDRVRELQEHVRNCEVVNENDLGENTVDKFQGHGPIGPGRLESQYSGKVLGDLEKSTNKEIELAAEQRAAEQKAAEEKAAKKEAEIERPGKEKDAEKNAPVSEDAVKEKPEKMKPEQMKAPEPKAPEQKAPSKPTIGGHRVR